MSLAEEHEKARAIGSSDDVASKLRERIKKLVALRHCHARYQGKVDYKKQPERGKQEVWVKGDSDSSMGDAIPLEGLKHLRNARLSLAAMLDHKMTRIDKFTVRLEGVALPSGQDWLVSVELDDKPMGTGACGHALIHCHIGPSHSSTPEVRAPMPTMKPWDALDWVLTLVLPRWEPAPWLKENAD